MAEENTGGGGTELADLYATMRIDWSQFQGDLGTVHEGLGGVSDGIDELSDDMAGANLAENLNLGEVEKGFGSLGKLVGGFIPEFKQLRGTIKEAAAALQGLWEVIAANPLGAAAIAIAAMGVGFAKWAENDAQNALEATQALNDEFKDLQKTLHGMPNFLPRTGVTGAKDEAKDLMDAGDRAGLAKRARESADAARLAYAATQGVGRDVGSVDHARLVLAAQEAKEVARIFAEANEKADRGVQASRAKAAAEQTKSDQAHADAMDKMAAMEVQAANAGATNQQKRVVLLWEIKRLEDEISATLFDREKRDKDGVELAGKRVELAKLDVDLAKDAADALKAESEAGVSALRDRLNARRDLMREQDRAEREKAKDRPDAWSLPVAGVEARNRMQRAIFEGVAKEQKVKDEAAEKQRDKMLEKMDKFIAGVGKETAVFR